VTNTKLALLWISFFLLLGAYHFKSVKPEEAGVRYPISKSLRDLLWPPISHILLSMPLECSGCHKRCARTSDLTKHEKRCDVLVMRNRKYDEFRRKTASNKRRHSSPSSERSRSSSRKRSRRERTPVVILSIPASVVPVLI